MKHLRIFIVFFMALALNLMLSEASDATTYYVSLSGSDYNDGSIVYPWRSIDHAINNTGPGDTVYLRGGSYDEPGTSLIIIDGSYGEGGSSGNWWTLKSYPGESATIQDALYIKKATYLRIEDLTIERVSGYYSIALMGGTGNYPICSYIEIRNNTFTGPQYNLAAINAWGDNILIEGNTVDFTVTGPTDGPGIYVMGGDGNVIRGNTIRNSYHVGIDLYNEQRPGHDDIDITNAIIEDNYVVGTTNGEGIMVAKNEAIAINNVIVRNNVVNNPSTYGIRIWALGSNSTHEITNIKVYNNTIHESGLSEIQIKTNSGNAIDGVDIKNNILSDSDGYHIEISGRPSNVTADYNLYSVTPNNSGIFAGINKVMGDSLFNNAASGDFHLQSSSSAINEGAILADVTDDYDGISRPQGPVHDIGAFEYVVPVQNSDTSAPVVTAFSVLSTSTSLTVPILTLTASDDRGVTGYMVSESSASPAATSSGWSSTAPTNYIFDSAGIKTLYAWAKDDAGNVSMGKGAMTTITLPDSNPPIVTDFSMPSTASSLTVPISTFTATDNVGVAGYMVSETSSVPSATSTGWSSTAPTNHTFSSAGTKILYAWAKDGVGNVSAGKSANVSISTEPSDTIPPTAPYGLSAVLDKGWKVDLSWNASSDNTQVKGYRVFRDGIQVGETANTIFIDNESASDASHSYAVKAIDASGNVSQSSNVVTVWIQKFHGWNKRK